MKMMVLIFRHSLEYDLLQLLSELEVKACTAAPKISGRSEPGTPFSSWHNSMIVAAVEDEQADRVVQRIKTFRDLLARQQFSDKVPLRFFAFPCESLI